MNFRRRPALPLSNIFLFLEHFSCQRNDWQDDSDMQHHRQGNTGRCSSKHYTGFGRRQMGDLHTEFFEFLPKFFLRHNGKIENISPPTDRNSGK